MTKVLLVGDLRTISNYGAIATSTALLKLLEDIEEIELSVIDGRSFWGSTPDKGWSGLKEKSHFRWMLINNAGFYKMALIAKKNQTKIPLNCGIPCRYEDFPLFAKYVLKGQYLKYEYRLLKLADVVVFNSEGSIVSGTDEKGMYRRSGLYILFMEYFSKIYLKKKCYVINHTVDPHNLSIKRMITNIYPLMDKVYVREKMSLELLEKWGVFNAEKVADALFSYNYTYSQKVVDKLIGKQINISEPYICVGDSSGIKNRFDGVKWDVEKVLGELLCKLRGRVCHQIVFIDGYNGTNKCINNVIEKNKLPSVSLNNCTHEELFSILAGSELFISGRWHASIMALLGKTPLLLWGADSHKTEALYKELDYPFRFFDINCLPIEIDLLCLEAKKVLRANLSEVWEKVERYRIEAKKNVQFLKDIEKE